MQPDELAKIVNRSGFLFQVAVEDHLRRTAREHSWSIIAHEYPWTSLDAARTGFIDLVAARGNFRCVFECKRTQGGEWIFLAPDGSKDTDELRVLWAYRGETGDRSWGWDDFRFQPRTLRSEFCIVRGASDDDRPLLERLGSDLVRAAESLAREDLSVRDRREGPMLYVPVIVTNARLYTCQVEPGAVDLATGEVPQSACFAEVSAIRFRKALLSDQKHDTRTYSTTAEGQLLKERSAMVVHISHLVEWLKRLEEAPSSSLPLRPYPWDVRTGA